MPEIDLSVGNYGIASRLPGRLDRARSEILGLEPPSVDSLEFASEMAERVSHRSAQVRTGYIRRADDPGAPVPPLATILRSGRGNAARLRLHLTLLWIAAKPPHTVAASAQAWARLLDLPDRQGSGARQVRSSLRWLDDHDLVQYQQIKGRGATTKLLSDLGNGAPYQVPGAAARKAIDAGLPAAREDIYVKVPSVFWTNGWVHLMSPPAIAMLLVLLDTRRNRPPIQELWFSQEVADHRYVLTEETRGRGLAELGAWGLVSTHSKAIQGTQLDAPRTRHAHLLDMDRLAEPPLKNWPIP